MVSMLGGRRKDISHFQLLSFSNFSSADSGLENIPTNIAI